MARRTTPPENPAQADAAAAVRKGVRDLARLGVTSVEATIAGETTRVDLPAALRADGTTVATVADVDAAAAAIASSDLAPIMRHDDLARTVAGLIELGEDTVDVAGHAVHLDDVADDLAGDGTASRTWPGDDVADAVARKALDLGYDVPSSLFLPEVVESPVAMIERMVGYHVDPGAPNLTKRQLRIDGLTPPDLVVVSVTAKWTLSPNQAAELAPYFGDGRRVRLVAIPATSDGDPEVVLHAVGRVVGTASARNADDLMVTTRTVKATDGVPFLDGQRVPEYAPQQAESLLDDVDTREADVVAREAHAKAVRDATAKIASLDERRRAAEDAKAEAVAELQDKLGPDGDVVHLDAHGRLRFLKRDEVLTPTTIDLHPLPETDDDPIAQHDPPADAGDTL